MFCFFSVQKIDIRYKVLFGYVIDEELYEVFFIFVVFIFVCGWKGLNYDVNVVLMFFFLGVKYYIL